MIVIPLPNNNVGTKFKVIQLINVIFHLLVKIIPRIGQIKVQNLERLTNDVRKKDLLIVAELVEKMTWQLVRVSDEVLVPIIMVWNGLLCLIISFLQTWCAHLCLMKRLLHCRYIAITRLHMQQIQP